MASSLWKSPPEGGETDTASEGTTGGVGGGGDGDGAAIDPALEPCGSGCSTDCGKSAAGSAAGAGTEALDEAALGLALPPRPQPPRGSTPSPNASPRHVFMFLHQSK